MKALAGSANMPMPHTAFFDTWNSSSHRRSRNNTVKIKDGCVGVVEKRRMREWEVWEEVRTFVTASVSASVSGSVARGQDQCVKGR